MTRGGRAEARHDVRRFVDASGVEWTAQLKRPGVPVPSGSPESPMVLFWSADRACMATLAAARTLSEMSTDELRRELRRCLAG